MIFQEEDPERERSHGHSLNHSEVAASSIPSIRGLEFKNRVPGCYTNGRTMTLKHN